MSIFDKALSRLPTNQNKAKPTGGGVRMITSHREYYYKYDGNLYKSDIVRACIRPKIKAIGKLEPRHIRYDKDNNLQVNPVPYIKELLARPNPLMTGQMWREKMATRLALTNNAFSLIMRDEFGKACGLYPIPCVMAEAVWDNNILYIRFTLETTGNILTVPYSDLIHLRNDYSENQVFGSDPAPALIPLMECVTTIDQGVVKAVRNSGLVRWLLKFGSAMRPEDIKRNTKEFVDNYLSYESDSFGAAGIDQKVDATQIEPKDYVPNAAVTDRITDRLYSFFNTNKNIVQSAWSENQWNAYYEAEIEPVAIQLGAELSAKLFSKKELSYGNEIVFEATNLQCASLQTKLNFVQFFDRGIMNANEIRKVFSLAPIETGDTYYVRKDTGAISTKGGEE